MCRRATRGPTARFLWVQRASGVVALEQLLGAPLLQALYSIASERMLMEQLEYNFMV